MKAKLIFLLLFAQFLAQGVLAQCASSPDIDFESHDYSNWLFRTGTYSGGFAFVWGAPTPITTAIPNRVQLTSNTGLFGTITGSDPYGFFSVVAPAPGNHYSVKLGTDVWGTPAEQAIYPITVPATSAYIVLNYWYAMVWEVSNFHTAAQQPFFDVAVYDAAHNLVNCTHINYNAINTPGFTNSTVPFTPPPPFSPQPDVWYRAWQRASVIVPASASGGTVEFTVTNCSGALHFGYAYIDMECGTFPDSINVCCPTPVTLPNAPGGYSSYKWYDATGGAWTYLGNVTEAHTLPDIPCTGFSSKDYALVMTPFPGFGCVETLYVHVNTDVTPVVAPMTPLTLCVGDVVPAPFTGPWTTGGTWSGYSTSIITVDPDGTIHAIASGTTSLTYTKTNFCGTASASTTIVVNPLPPPPIITETTGHHCEGETLTFCVTGMAGAPIIFSYSAGGPSPATSIPATLSGTPGSTIPGTFCITLTAVPPSVTFMVEAITDPLTGCTRWLNIDKKICVAPHPRIDSITGPDSICETEIRTYTAHFPPSLGGGSWSIIPGPGTPAGSATTVFPASNTTGVLGGLTGYVTLKFTISNCCGDSTLSKVIFIKPMPVIPTVTYTGCMVPCPGAPLTFIVTGTPSSTIAWSWTDPGGTTSITYNLLLDASGHGNISIPGGAGSPGSMMITIYSATLGTCTNTGGMDHPFDIEWPVGYIQVPRDTICDSDCIGIFIQGYPGRDVYVTEMPSGVVHTVHMHPMTGDAILTVCPPLGTTTYQITGVVGICCTHMYPGPSVTITVKPYPVVTLSPSTVCEGDPLVLIATSTPPSPFFDWFIPGFAPVSSGPTYTVTLHATPANDGIYTVTAWNGPCPTSASTTVTVTPRPMVPIATYTGCVVPCPGTPLTFTLSGTPGTLVNWSWTDANGVLMPGASVLLNSLGTGTITIPGGACCPGTMMITLLSMSINGCPYPIGMDFPLVIDWPKAYIQQVDKTTICKGDCAHISVQGYPGKDVFLTEVPGGTTYTVHMHPLTGDAVFTACPTVTTTYQITGVEGTCCTHMYPGPSITITVLPYPVVTLSPSTVCEGHPLLLTATSTPPSPFFDWFIPGLAPVSSGPTYLVTSHATPANDGVYSVTGWNGPCATTVTTTITVTVPWASMWCESKCNQEGVTVAVLHFIANPLSTVFFNTVPAGGPDIAVPIDIAGHGTYTVTITGSTAFVINDVITADGCRLSMSLPGCIVEPAVKPTVTCWQTYDETGFHFGFTCLTATPGAPVTVNFTTYVTDGTTTCIVNATVVLTSSAPLPITACMLAAYFPVGCTLSPCSPSTMIATITGTSVELGDCKWAENLYCGVSRPAGNGDNTIDRENSSNRTGSLTVVPNPNNGMFTLFGSLAGTLKNGEVTIEVIDMLGKTILSETTRSENGKISKEVHMPNSVANGVYMIKIRNDVYSQVLRVILDR